MSIAEFFVKVNDNWTLMILCIIASFFLYYIAYKRFWKSLLDPLTISLVASSFGFSVVLFLYFDQLIRPLYFFSYVTTQTCFFSGFLIANKKSKYPYFKNVPKIRDIDSFTKCVFIACSSVHVICQLLQYKILGIPLFMTSRLDGMLNAGGAGILMRFIGICSSLSLIMAFYFVTKGKSTSLIRNYTKLYLLFVIITFFLGASRSALLNIGTSFFFFAVITEETKPKFKKILQKNEVKFICLALMFAIAINCVKYGGFYNGIYELGVRLIGFGDTYFYAYPNDMLMNIDDSQPFKSIFSSFLGFFRIYSYSELPNSIGLDLFRQFSDSDEIGGPNARHNIVALLYFGLLGGAIFSYVLGWLTGFSRKLFFAQKYKTLFGACIIAWVYSAGTIIETDVNLYFFNINSFIVVLPIIFLLATILYCAGRLKQHYYSNSNGTHREK